MKIKRITALLALIAAASAAVSCGDTAAPAPAPKTETGTTALSEDSITEEVQEYPYEIKDFGGYVFKVLNQDDKLWDGTTHILDFDSESGEPINDAIYTRNRNVEEKLNFKLEVIKDVIDGNSIRKKMEQSVLSADDAYAAVYLPLNYSGSTSFTGEYTMNLNDIDTLHLTESWWNQAFISSATIGDQLLYTSIDNFNLMGIAWSNAVLFNKNMFESYDYDLPYDAVRKGAWTYDMMYSLIKNVVNLNGADNWDATSDGSCTYGFVTEHSGGIISLLSGSGEFLIQRNDKNIPELNIGNQRLIAAYDSLLQAFSQPGWCLLHNEPGVLQARDIFIQGRALFTLASLGSTLSERLRNTSFEYGMVPVPKFDEQQETYCTAINQNTLALNIPKTVSAPETAGAIIDYLAFVSCRDIVPILDVSLCYKGVRDDDSIEMIDIIQNTQVVDIGNLYGWTTTALQTLCTNITKGNNKFVSTLTSSEKSINKEIDKLFK